MDPLPLHEIAQMCGGVLAANDASRTVTRVSKDTRTLSEGDLYLALRGPSFDGNAFVADAADRGAIAAIVDRDPDPAVPSGFPIIRVPDSLAALRQLAAAWRERLNLRVVCITGSSGKTSTKDFTAAVLAARYRVAKTSGNLNNHIGLPLTILEASSAEQAAVWEIGMNRPGEIGPLAALARPDAAIITNIGVAHIEFFGSREAIAAEKAALACQIPSDGIVIVPSGDDFADFIASRSAARTVRAGLGAGDVSGEILFVRENESRFRVRVFGEETEASIPVPGEHMVSNALLAIAAGVEFGLSLDDCAEGLRSARVAGGRLQAKTIRGLRVIDDSYNANPDSVEAALHALASISASGHRIAVLGRMGELGDYADAGYRRVGAAAARTVDALITVGPDTAPLCRAATENGLEEVHQSRDNLEATRVLLDLAREGDLVLIKGSRSARMEQIVGGLEN
jgi:UDP-N-acetylmuramoyl-tripeptide--D-alanyl-D-alanine ligase